MSQMILLFISSMLVSNVVLSQFLGICPFLGVSKKTETAAGMGAINHFLLVPNEAEYLQTIVFILVIAGLVQFVEMVLKKMMPALYQSLGVFLPLITTNCAVLGVASNNASNYPDDFLMSIAYALGISFGFLIAIVLMASIRERIEHNDIPESFKGSPIVLITAGLMAIAFCGFSGLIKL